MAPLRLYCQGQAPETLLGSLRQLEAARGIPFEVRDLATNGAYDPAKERAAYERDFRPHANDLKRATGASITKLRSHTGNHFVSTPPTLALLRDGRPAWWCHGEEAILKALDGILTSGKPPA